MKRLAALLLFVAGCSSVKSDPWQDYLIALQVHDFELKAMRQAEQIEQSAKQQEALARCRERYERALAHLRECSDRVGTVKSGAAKK